MTVNENDKKGKESLVDFPDVLKTIANEDPRMNMLEKESHISESDHLSYSNIPERVKTDIIDLAKYLYDVRKNKVIITGKELSGKTFCVEQFSHHAERILHDAKMIPSDVPIEVFHADVKDFVGKETEYIETIVKNTIQSFEGEVIIYTSSAITAGLIESALPTVPIILEIKPKIIQDLQNRGIDFSQWNFVADISANYTKRDVIETLTKYHKPALESHFDLTIPRTFISNFVNHVYEHSTILQDEDEQDKLYEDEQDISDVISLISNNESDSSQLPIGFWVAMLSETIGEIKFRPDKYYRRDGHISQAKTFDHVIDEYRSIIQPNSSLLNAIMEATGSGPGSQKEITILSGVGSPQAMGIDLSQETPGGHDNQPLEYSDITTLSDRIKKKVIGQDDVVDSACNGFMISAAGLRDMNKPVRSMLLLGPTGVGKTKLAQTISEELGQEEMHMIRVDMSEFSKEHEVSKLFGAPAGYVGHEEGGVLTNQVKEHPHSIILLDEVEKAHHQVWDPFLQVFDAGRMTDSQGDVIDFKNTVIIMTSNLGSNIPTESSIGYASSMNRMSSQEKKRLTRKNAMKAAKEYFKPELINRLDDILIFDHLHDNVLKSIASLQLDELIKKVSETSGDKDELIKPDDKVLVKILENSDAGTYGARDIARNVSKNVTHLVAESMIKSTDKEGRSISLYLNDDNELAVQVDEKKSKPSRSKNRGGRISSRGSGRVSNRAKKS